MLEAPFYAIDLFVGFSLPVYLHLRHHPAHRIGPPRRPRSRPDTTAVVRLFWLGVVIGLTWEVPIFISASFATNPIIDFVREPPLHPLVFMIAHAFWDGGLFLAGLALVQALSARPVLSAFRWRELVVLTLWGQTSALAVEVVSVVNDAWVYDGDRPWNPVLFSVSGHPITALPQIVWLVAPVAYYLAASLLVRRWRAAHRRDDASLG